MADDRSRVDTTLHILVRLTEKARTIVVEVDPFEPLARVHSRLVGQRATASTRLIFRGRTLEGGRSCAEHGIQQASTLWLASRLRGGHCQVPCGIFDDPKLVADVKEASATVRKAMQKISELSASQTSAQNMNQLIRWVDAKEKHCARIVTHISEYCLCQRVKREAFSSEQYYLDALVAHHEVLLAAVKAKQSVDVRAADQLDHSIEDWSRMYRPTSSSAGEEAGPRPRI